MHTASRHGTIYFGTRGMSKDSLEICGHSFVTPPPGSILKSFTVISLTIFIIILSEYHFEF